MNSAIKELLKQPYWVLALVLGVILVLVPYVTVDKDYRWNTHPATATLPVWIGTALLVLSAGGFLLTFRSQQRAGTGLDLSRVKESDGVLSTSVGGCEIRVTSGRIEDVPRVRSVAVVLPCNEYFDDECAKDTNSALGAYVNRVFDGQAATFATLIQHERQRQLGPGVEEQKTSNQRAESFGPGRCMLIERPLQDWVPIALVSSTTQRAGEGLAARISYLFQGMRELVERLADARLNEVVMPILGAGHGHIDAPMALVGLLLAVAEAARYGQGGQRLRRATIVVFKPDGNKAADVNPVIIRRALALIGSGN